MSTRMLFQETITEKAELSMSVEVLRFENGPFMVNSYLLVNKKTGESIIIDPGYDVSGVISAVKQKGRSLVAIVATHGHLDHVEGVNAVKKEFDVPFLVNERDNELVATVSMQARMFGVPDPGVPEISESLPLEGSIELAGIPMELRHTPGHSPGSVSILVEKVVFSGDALFNFSIGRTDLPGGSYEELISSIREQLFTLPDDILVMPGHGPETTIGNEKAMNPFFN